MQQTTQAIGAQIRQYRKEQSLTLVELAESCNISASFLSQIEREQANPSVTTLYAITDVLGVSMASFFTAPETDNSMESQTSSRLQESAEIIRATQRKVIIYPGSEIRNELLVPDLRRAIQMMWIVMPPGTDSGNTPFTHDGEECGVILQGQIKTWVGSESFILGPGDAIYHASTLPHRSENIGDTDVIMVVAKTPPSI